MFAPIGIFDSGYGGLTVMKEILQKLPQYDYIYLGDNARAPYGNRSFDTVYHYTLQCVQWFFDQGCPLVILACNTASAKALRTIQQNDLPKIAPDNRVLGVIRPTSEIIGSYTDTKKIGILATRGTVQSESYRLEIDKFFPDIEVHQEACPMWVPLVENNEHQQPGADYFIEKHLQNILQHQKDIDLLLLACTHYPLLMNKIKQFIPDNIKVLSQGLIVAESLADYLQRHPEMEQRCSKSGTRAFFTTDDPNDFNHQASIFFGEPLQSNHVAL
ncbi:glutamate racemase [Pseudoflavitalea sp. G-6-1-2]|uniref:glutamate racemase n=1 Tax=Pseudoflavitalea sp. G-6-1-2 TaxID=2728841 RepID=UPI00146AD9AD|nr:glutamate racemase [Pseudoflavitalea sp. G-6-1-2]NML19751.1 glutamate racemase [Pseudoflavitalea sp. G-6-1-2]